MKTYQQTPSTCRVKFDLTTILIELVEKNLLFNFKKKVSSIEIVTKMTENNSELSLLCSSFILWQIEYDSII